MTTETSPAPQARPTVGAVVLTWRDRDQTAACVAHLLDGDAVSRVVVVDNEADGTIASAIPADPRLSFRELDANTGFAVGVNAGMRELLADASIDQLLVINNDATLTAADLELLRAELDRSPALGVVGPRIITPEGQQFSAGGVLSRVTWSIRQPRPGEQPDFLTWACVLLRRETLESAGLLDERFFMYWEDVEYGLRLSGRGIAFAEVGDARLVHAVSSSHARAGSRILAYSSQAFRHFLRLHGGRTRVTGYARLAAKTLITAITGDLRGARYVLAGWRLGRDAPDPAYPAFDRLP
ncbi:glycosyltransferase [Microbacterium luteum]|uniref:glycosyltransferase n=1 Tax=Microbacterium luteum TaxID=2782167 RepID=UPI001888CED6|nr:glycosyltransferase family 2 protein [Microbacterium luteum]